MTHRTWGFAIVIASLAGGAGLEAARLRPEAVTGWNRYVAAIDARRAQEARDGHRFLALDFAPEADAERRSFRAGEVVVRTVERTADVGAELPDALIHHWRGAVLLPGVTLDQVMTALETEPPGTGPEVLSAAVLRRGPGTMTLHLRLKRTRVVTAVYDTEHSIRFFHESQTRASSVSTATRMVEVADAGTPSEHTLAPGDDRGFLWRLQVYWRYEAVPGGVVAECESLSLSRGIPFGLQTIAGPLVTSTARESMSRTLEEVRRRFS